LVRRAVVRGYGPVDEDRQVAVAGVVAAVLGDLRAGGLDLAKIYARAVVPQVVLDEVGRY
jgi:hypothetical protein